MLRDLRRQQKAKCFDDIFETIRNSNRRCVVVCFHFVGTTTHSNGHESAVDQTIESSRADLMRTEKKQINKGRQFILLSPLFAWHKRKEKISSGICMCMRHRNRIKLGPRKAKANGFLGFQQHNKNAVV